MLELIKLIIQGIWALLEIPLIVDGLTIKVWHILAFFAILAVMINGLFGKNGGEV